ncbi:MAG: RNA methyltransferase [Candidatus Moranbacteria bacterium]|nr:RNA methyltransferase [Candidatus Moranbacteria bacterium]
MGTRVEKLQRKNKREIIVVCHNIRSAFNIGSIFRTADGAGVAGVYLTGYSPAPPHPGISKTALGAEGSVFWKKFSKIDDSFRFLKKNNYEIAALEQDEKSISLDKFKPKRKIALILGNEVRGLSPAILRKCDKIIEIPMQGKKESLNVSVAFGIAAYSLAMNSDQ